MDREFFTDFVVFLDHHYKTKLINVTGIKRKFPDRELVQFSFSFSVWLTWLNSLSLLGKGTTSPIRINGLHMVAPIRDRCQRGSDSR